MEPSALPNTAVVAAMDLFVVLTIGFDLLYPFDQHAMK
jgi:hypothetical protein